jgi:hypothetical protein
MRNTVLIARARIVAVGCGWLWGASARWTAERAMHALEVRQDLVEGRSALLDACLAVYSVTSATPAVISRMPEAFCGEPRTRTHARGEAAKIISDVPDAVTKR